MSFILMRKKFSLLAIFQCSPVSDMALGSPPPPPPQHHTPRGPKYNRLAIFHRLVMKLKCDFCWLSTLLYRPISVLTDSTYGSMYLD